MGKTVTVLLVNPDEKTKSPKYPVGLMNIGAYLEKNNRCKVWISDYSRKNGGWKLDSAPDIIGVSIMYNGTYQEGRKLIAFLRKKYPDAIIVAGGHLAAARAEELLLSTPELNAVCYGEGEIPMAALVSSPSKYYYLETSPNWITRINEFLPVNALIENLDDIPPYDLSMLKHPEEYLNANDDVFSLGTVTGEKDIPLFATRGCPNHCTFCASQFVHGHKVRRYSNARIKKDIIYYCQEYGMRSFPFLDDDFLADKEKALDILDFLYNHGRYSRIFNLQYNNLDRTIIQALKRTGSDRVLITMDGLDEAFLRKVVRKPANFKKAKEVIGICREEKLTVISNIIIGFPGETKESISAGVANMLNMGANWYAILVANPFHGSELYETCKREGYLVGDGVDYHSAVIKTPEFDPKWIKWKAYEINLRLNFVENYDMRHGDYVTPLGMFERVIRDVAPNHAFSYYYAAICAWRLRDYERYLEYMVMFGELKETKEWKSWVEHFNLEEV